MDVRRRFVLGGLAAGPALAAMPAQPANDPRANDPRQTATGLVRLQGSLDPQVVSPWWYEVAIYGVIERAAPVLMMRAEGCETYAVRREPGGLFRSHGVTVTAFKGAADDAWIDQLDNPVTHRRNLVRPNIITGASFVYPADGSVPLPASGVGGWVKWLQSGAMVGCMMERTSLGAVQPYMETTSIWCDAAAFFASTAAVRDATFSSTFLVPWPGWMEMGDLPGHLLWHSTGRKLRGLDDLPGRYRARAEHLAPGVLSRDPYA